MSENKRNLSSQSNRAADFKENQLMVAKIVPNPLGFRSNNRFAQCETLKDARRRIDFGEKIGTIRNNADIATVNRLHYFHAILHPQIINVPTQATPLS